MKNWIKNVILFLSLCINCFFISYTIYTVDDIDNSNDKKIITITKIKQDVVPYDMSDWEIFTLALMKVESNYTSTAVSSAGAKGYFQITPIYIKEVNNKHNTNYSMNDVTDLKKSFEIFELMQQTHNKNYDINKAIELHNGKHVWYHRRVMNAYDEIKKYEDIRNKLINIRKNSELNKQKVKA